MISSNLALGAVESIGREESTQDRFLLDHKGVGSGIKRWPEEEENPLAALEGQLAALLNNGFFSPVTTLGSDPDGAGGALTLGPASAAASALMFKLESDPNLIPV